MNNLIFFIGKGGVGKSTISSLLSLHLANRNKNTLLISMDPAHNLQDIFQKKFSENTYQIDKYLSVIQIDIEKQTKQYLKTTAEKIERVYQYQTAFGLKNYFKVLKHAPGLEEYALLQAFAQIIKKYSKKDYLIFDMPPTALSMRFFSLPENSLIWLKELIKLRKAIIEKKEIITKIKFGKKEIETDKVNNQLKILNNEHIEIQKLLKSNQTKINIVLNSDDLSIKEAGRINKSLKDIQLKAFCFIENKFHQISDNKNIPFKTIKIPENKTALIGIEELNQFISNHQLSESLMQCIE